MRKKVALLGCGALAGIIAKGINTRLSASYELSGVLGGHIETAARFASQYGCKAYADIAELLADKPDYVAEAANGEAVKAYGRQILTGGADLIILSIGALADKAVYESFKVTASQSQRKIHLASGAIGGLDMVRAICLMDKGEVVIKNIKAPNSLNGAPYLGERKLSTDEREIVFKGNADEAIKGFPKNVNVAVATALAGNGTADTGVEIISQPGQQYSSHSIEAKNSSVFCRMEFNSLPDKDNPRSSTIAGWSVVALLENLASPVQFF